MNFKKARRKKRKIKTGFSKFYKRFNWLAKEQGKRVD